ncbi:uncharacterized protein K452DRAFT_354442 [Aplosporella prunicola CBS 121167]|uniref:TatD family hydrolase n=1 Tax=Aplosporella prunicola CBS 121167 TaxID=1176127 RepID=A0A6A6AU91_9PEZI|nr:uncharacterized protein K452DRAFT_354442 [Aplosporella prunicola CBS 121167]KAF2135270.1 hypothetical protein K452DRAFT_354442 [Aplosporella prunicola CBS 121167]
MANLPTTAPPAPTKPLRYADVAVTATANDFAGIYRGKQYHAPDFAGTLDRAHALGVEKVMLTGMSLADVPVNTGIAAARPPGQCFLTIGVHPYHAGEMQEGGAGYVERLAAAVREALAVRPRLLAAFGELGLDYDRLNHAGKEAQLEAFKTQLELFVNEGWDLPLFLHCRAAYDDFVEVMKPYVARLPRRGLVHSFVGSAAQMQGLLDLGLDVSVNGFSFRDAESVDMVRAVPLDRLQLETDAPWGEIKPSADVARYLVHAPSLPASRKRDKWVEGCMVKERNESCAISRVAFVVAGLKGMAVEEVAEAAWRNSVRMFGMEGSEGE